MFILPEFKSISLNRININQHWDMHLFLNETPSLQLKQSLQDLGVLHPPIVQQTTKGNIDLICGRRRLYALKHYFNQTNVCCLILPPDLPTRSLAHYILTDQQLNGPLSPMEAAYFLKYCMEDMDAKEVVTCFLPRLGYKPQPDFLNQLLSLLKLDKKIQRQIHTGLIIEKTALELLELPEEDRFTLSTLIELLQPGTGKQKRLLTLSRDIAKRTQQTITSLLEGEEFKQIIEHDEMNPPQKIHTLLELLQKKFYARSSDTEQAFKDRVRKLALPDNVTVTHSLNFEKDEIFLTIRFPDLQSCETARRKKQIV
jgi:ParB-like chromosome segregation protein Spo0J